MATRIGEFEQYVETARALLAHDDGRALGDANALVNQALRLRPGDTGTWILKCQVLAALGDEVAALAAIEMALRRAPHSAEAHYWHSAVLGDLERYADALLALERGFRHAAPEDDWLAEELFFEKATVLVALDRRDAAIETFEAGLLRCPASALLQSGLKPLLRARQRSELTVLPGGLP